jgi:hypothetical protein
MPPKLPFPIRVNRQNPQRKTIDGKTYCFQNDPALTKPQGGGG